MAIKEFKFPMANEKFVDELAMDRGTNQQISQIKHILHAPIPLKLCTIVKKIKRNKEIAANKKIGCTKNDISCLIQASKNDFVYLNKINGINSGASESVMVILSIAMQYKHITFTITVK